MLVLADSDWPAWLALLVAGGALTWQVVTYFMGRDDRRRRDDEMRNMRQAQTEALVQIAATAGGSSLERDHAEGAQLSAEIREARPNVFEVVVTNLGPGGAQLRGANLGEPYPGGLSLGPTGIPEAGGAIDLLPSEKRHIKLYVDRRAVRTPIDLTLNWLDSKGHQERVVSLMLPS